MRTTMRLFEHNHSPYPTVFRYRVRRALKSSTALAVIAAGVATMVAIHPALAQAPGRAPLPAVVPPPATATAPQSQQSYDAAELERITSPIALYPDALLSQVLTAATFSAQIPDAERWSEDHANLSGPRLADALSADQVSWDPSVQALIAFPTVLQMMANAMPWTTELGDAFQAQHADVMDAVQHLRAQAQRYGYLQSTPQLRVTRGSVIEIDPVDPEYVVVPYYDPLVVFYAPRPGFILSSSIYWGYGVRLGLWYEPWGLWSPGFAWQSHRVFARYPGWNHPFGYADYGHRLNVEPGRGFNTVRGNGARPLITTNAGGRSAPIGAARAPQMRSVQSVHYATRPYSGARLPAAGIERSSGGGAPRASYGGAPRGSSGGGAPRASYGGAPRGSSGGGAPHGGGGGAAHGGGGGGSHGGGHSGGGGRGR